jgi:uncharacterized protein (TIGR02246 family)
MSFPAGRGCMGMADNETQIRTLIERWVAAVHAGDMDGVLADHAEDIVMFDVPPPHDGVRGLAAYRETWPPFFRWQASGAVFEIVSLDVTAGDDVAFAHALLRCDTPEGLDRDPQTRLRLTIGLRKENGRWTVTHEHHSFPDRSQPDEVGEAEVRAVHDRWDAGTAAKDLDELMANIADDVVSYEHEVPLEYVGIDAVRELCSRSLDAAESSRLSIPELSVLVRGDLAVAWGLNRVSADDREFWSRATRVFRRIDGSWQMIHQHLSFPFDPATGAARTDLRP